MKILLTDFVSSVNLFVASASGVEQAIGSQCLSLGDSQHKHVSVVNVFQCDRKTRNHAFNVNTPVSKRFHFNIASTWIKAKIKDQKISHNYVAV